MSSQRDSGGFSQEKSVTPMGIAENDLFTAREKIELLTQLKADVAGARQEGVEPGFEAGDIDEAIAAVRHSVEAGGTSDLEGSHK